jgi:hypothetical protein
VQFNLTELNGKIVLFVRLSFQLMTRRLLPITTFSIVTFFWILVPD